MPMIEDVPQLWWEIICTYDGTPDSCALSAGNTAQEAKDNFLRSLAEPEEAVITSITPLAKCKFVDLLSIDLRQRSDEN